MFGRFEPHPKGCNRNDYVSVRILMSLKMKLISWIKGSKIHCVILRRKTLQSLHLIKFEFSRHVHRCCNQGLILIGYNLRIGIYPPLLTDVPQGPLLIPSSPLV